MKELSIRQKIYLDHNENIESFENIEEYDQYFELRE